MFFSFFLQSVGFGGYIFLRSVDPKTSVKHCQVNFMSLVFSIDFSAFEKRWAKVFTLSRFGWTFPSNVILQCQNAGCNSSHAWYILCNKEDLLMGFFHEKQFVCVTMGSGYQGIWWKHDSSCSAFGALGSDHPGVTGGNNGRECVVRLAMDTQRDRAFLYRPGPRLLTDDDIPLKRLKRLVDLLGVSSLTVRHCR